MTWKGRIVKESGAASKPIDNPKPQTPSAPPKPSAPPLQHFAKSDAIGPLRKG